MKKLYRCSVCGYVHEGDAAPDICPKCLTEKKFSEVEEELATKIRRSDKSNDLHMELVTLCMKIDELAVKGIEDDLDPACVRIFERAKKMAWELKQSSKAEMAGHMNKGKW